MKLFRKNKILALILFFAITVMFVNSKKVKATPETAGPKTTPDQAANPSDAVYKRINQYILDLAEEKMKTSDLTSKKKMVGALPEGYPADVIKRALQTRTDKKKWKPILDGPTEMYRVCLYPNAKVNYVKWCANNFFGAKNKAETCLYNFCEVCCDHLVFIFQNAAEKNIIGELLQLNQEQGIKAIKDIIDRTTIHDCKAKCKAEYPVEMPKPEFKPPRDPELGTQKKPALSCQDIKTWGSASAKSDVYWIELQSKGPQKVFCDMETDKGGWTLFFNYLHHPGQDVLLNENKLPNDLKTNSHMYLENAGFERRDIKELLFFCTERYKAEKKFWHFKTNNADLITVSLNGDQTNLKPNSIAQGYVDIKPPSNIQGNYVAAINSNSIGRFDTAGKNPKGGFTATAFGSAVYEAYWTVKGDLPAKELFECGTSHRSSGSSPDDSPTMVFTHHSIWFRGNPPSLEEARERYMKNINNKVIS